MSSINWADWPSFEISITTYCQASCPLCARTDRNTGKLKDFIDLKHSNIDTIMKTIKDIAKYTNVKKIQICGDYGDPLMHPKIEDIIYEINKHNLWADISTNGGIRNLNFYKKIAKTNTTLIFGIDGIDEYTSSKYRMGVNFDKAMKNMITHATETKDHDCVRKKTQWDFLIFDYNYHQLDDAIKIAEQHNIKINFRINVREWNYKITDQKLIDKINNKYSERMLK
jgi:MoaA/NifB/PqqE/SkfB family radical SAM enzyme